LVDGGPFIGISPPERDAVQQLPFQAVFASAFAKLER
jgi:hypothetical protein